MTDLVCFGSCSMSSGASDDISIFTQAPVAPTEQTIDDQAQILRYALGLKAEPVLIWRLYRLCRVNHVPFPSDLLRELDHLAECADRGASAARADDAQRRSIALLEYAHAIEDGERPTLALRVACEKSELSANAIKTMASRLHIRTRPYRARSRRFDTDILSRASDPFGLTK